MTEQKGYGYIGKNSYKEKDNQPDYRGKITVEDKNYDVAGWIKQGNHGKFISVAVNEPYKKTDSGDFQSPPPETEEEDVPF